MFDNLISYKRGYLDKIKKAYEENNKKESLQITLKPDILFSIDISKYIFLAAANSNFPNTLKKLERMSNYISHLVDDYFKIIQQKDRNNLPAQDYEELKILFYTLYNNYELICVFTYFLLSKMNKFYDEYFNLNYLDNIKTSFEQTYDLENDIIDYKTRFQLSELEKIFSNSWAQQPRLKSDLHHIKKSIIFKIRFIKYYFFKT